MRHGRTQRCACTPRRSPRGANEECLKTVFNAKPESRPAALKEALPTHHKPTHVQEHMPPPCLPKVAKNHRLNENFAGKPESFPSGAKKTHTRIVLPTSKTTSPPRPRKSMLPPTRVSNDKNVRFFRTPGPTPPRLENNIDIRG